MTRPRALTGNGQKRPQVNSQDHRRLCLYHEPRCLANTQLGRNRAGGACPELASGFLQFSVTLGVTEFRDRSPRSLLAGRPASAAPFSPVPLPCPQAPCPGEKSRAGASALMTRCLSLNSAKPSASNQWPLWPFFLRHARKAAVWLSELCYKSKCHHLASRSDLINPLCCPQSITPPDC